MIVVCPARSPLRHRPPSLFQTFQRAGGTSVAALATSIPSIVSALFPIATGSAISLLFVTSLRLCFIASRHDCSPRKRMRSSPFSTHALRGEALFRLLRLSPTSTFNFRLLNLSPLRLWGSELPLRQVFSTGGGGFSPHAKSSNATGAPWFSASPNEVGRAETICFSRITKHGPRIAEHDRTGHRSRTTERLRAKILSLSFA